MHTADTNLEGGVSNRKKAIHKNTGKLFIDEMYNVNEEWAPKFPSDVKLIKLGAETLTDAELLNIIFKKEITQADEDFIISSLSQTNSPQYDDALRMRNIDYSSMILILSLHELKKRLFDIKDKKIRSTEDVFESVKHLGDQQREHFLSISLDANHKIINTHVVSIGSMNKTIVHPREVFYDVIIDRASCFCIAHNHPSGSVIPSEDDDDITRRLVKAADLLGITLLDHIIFTKNEYYSYIKEKRI